MWRIILDCVATSSKHKDCLRILANVVIQRVLCRAQHSKDVVSHVYQLSDEIFGKLESKKEDEAVSGLFGV